MPKKFKGENTKATSAKERKAAKVNEERNAREKAAEDAYWQDDDKNLAKKNKRKEEKEKKQQEQLQKKIELKNILENEETSNEKPKLTPKVTQFQIQEKKAKQAALQAKAAEEEELAKRNIGPALDSSLLVENTNKMEDLVSASGVDAAVRALTVEVKAVAKGGRVKVNMAAAYRSFEENRLPGIKKENPSLKHSQLIQRIKKEWQKSPENPTNQLC